MKTLITLILFLLLLPICVEAAEPPMPKGERIRSIIAEKYPKGNVYVGGSTGWRRRPSGSGVIVDREFSYITPDNDYKQSAIHPSPGVWKWDVADAWVEHCAKNGQTLRLHGPGSPQCSRWAKDDSRTPEELKKNFVEYITALCKRYDKYEHVKWIDVVNETVMNKGEWHTFREGNDRWECPWTKMGFDESHPLKPPLYIKMAFEIANKHAPNTKLIINQHAEMEEPMWEKVKALVPYLRGKGLRVDGIGWQGHVNVGWEKDPDNMKKLHALIDWAHSNKLSFHITEMNAWFRGKGMQSKEIDLDAQAKTYAALFGALLEHRENGIVTWNVWGISDANAWMQEKKWEGCTFDREYRAKPAHYAIQKLLENPPPPRKK